jgi:hypothetical protein
MTRIVTHTGAQQLLRAGHAATIRRRMTALRLAPPTERSGPRRSWTGWALVLVDGLPTVVRVHTLTPGQAISATMPQPTRGGRRYGWRVEEVAWALVLGLGREWTARDLIV